MSTTIPRRAIGQSGITIAPLMFGGNVFGWTADAAASFQLLDTFVELGFNAVDTADMYSTWVPGHQGGESESILGQWIAQGGGRREKIVLATKVGMEMGDGSKGLSRDTILRGAENSLRRLQTDHIDLYQSHEDDAGVPLDETLKAYDQLIRQGKVRAIGASNYNAARLAEALSVSERDKLPAYVSLQPEYNLYDRAGFEKELEPLCLEKHIGVITYYSLASGFLSGKYRTEADLGQSVRGQGIGKKYLNPRGLAILAALDEAAAAHGVSQAAIALAWLIHRPSVTAPIVSATRVEQLRELAKAVEVKLTPDQLQKLNDASA